MLIHGIRKTIIASEGLADQCPNCKSKWSVNIEILQRYVHVFWIPLFPINKTGLAKCNKCGHEWNPSSMDTEMRQSYDNMKRQSKPAIWHFAGILIIIPLALYFISASFEHDKLDKIFINQPQTGDTYEVKKGYKKYTLYKVSRISDDTLYILKCRFDVPKFINLISLKNNESNTFRNVAEVPILKGEIKRMFDNDEIMNINRNP